MVWVAAVATIMIAILTTVAAGSPHYIPPVKYGQQFTLYFNVFDSNSPWRFYATAPAAADVHIIKDGGTAAAATNSITDLGKTFSLVLTATEMQAAVVIVEVNDLSSPGLYMDDSWAIPTYGHTAALNRLDLDMANVSADTNTVGGNASVPTNMIVVYATDFATDYNTTTDMWNVDVKYVHGETPEADVVDTILEVNEYIAALQVTANTIDDKADTIQTVTDALPDGGALTSLAPAATALSTATWTNTKAGYLDMNISDVNLAVGDVNTLASAILASVTVQDTNVAAGDTAITFTLSAGKLSSGAYLYHLISVTDANDGNKETRVISAYTADRIVTVNSAFSFTPAVGDVVKIWAIGYFRLPRNPLTDPLD